MAWLTGTAADDICLWKATYKINSDNRGFNFNVWIANKAYADARLAAEDLGKRMIELLPQDAEIFRAVLYKWDLTRNGYALRNCVGKGNYGNLQTTPAVESCDNVRSSILIRLEDADGRPVPRQFNLVPDSVVVANDLVNPVTDVVGFAGPLPALPVSNDTYAVQFNAFLKALVYETHHVQKNPKAGGTYKYQNWSNAYVTDVSVKRGGRVFIG